MTDGGVTEGLVKSDAGRMVARAGLAARGVLYLLVAYLALGVATGEFQQADKQGALQEVAGRSGGRLALVVLTLGFTGYALWSVAEAWVGQGRQGIGKRMLWAGRALVYLALVASAVAVYRDGSSGGGGDQQEQEWTARLLGHGLGRWVVGLVGLGLIGIGGYLLAKGVGRKFLKRLDRGAMPGWLRSWVPALGVVGYVARAVVVVLIGWFVFQAALDFDATEAVGVDGALKRLALRPHGPGLLTAVAAGLAAFGLYSFVEAGYRRVLEE